MHMQRSMLMCLGQPDPKICLGLGAHKQTNTAYHVAVSDPCTDRPLLTFTSHRYFNKQVLPHSTLMPVSTAEEHWVVSLQDPQLCKEGPGWGILTPETNTHSRQVPETPFTYFLPVKSCYMAARGKSKKLGTKAIISLQHPALRDYSTTVPPLATGSLHRKRN